MNRSLYVASRASIPERPAMWKYARDILGYNIISTWIDEAGDGETKDFAELWSRIQKEITNCDALVLYVEETDLPLKGAFIEVGMAIALGKPIHVCFPGNYALLSRNELLGSWIYHPLVNYITVGLRATGDVDDGVVRNLDIISYDLINTQ